MRTGKHHLIHLAIIPILFLYIGWLDPYADAVSEGNKKFQEKKYSEADVFYKKAEEYLPHENDRAALAFNRGNAHYMQENYDQAIEFYKQSLKSDQKDIQKKALFNLGNSYYKKGDINSAVAAYKNALNIDPAYEPVKKNLEYLLKPRQNNDKKKNQTQGDKSQDNKKDKQQKEGQQSPTDKKQEKSPNGSGQSKTGLNRDQIKNLLQQMKHKPVRRQKGSGKDGTRVLEHAW
jgi:Ca-activated chloride channel family protein